MNPKVSVIIPVYNLESYVEECIKSIVDQYYTNLEIIIINDGSTDSTLKKIESLASKDCRIKVIDQANTGVSSARNHGLLAASGDYVAFVDGDDWIDPKYIESLTLNAIESNAEIVKGGFKFVDEKTKTFRKTLLSKKIKRIDKDKAIDSFLLGHMTVTVCGSLFKRSLLINNNLTFQDGVKIGEDGQYMMKAICVCNCVCLIPEIAYNVRVRMGSASRNMSDFISKDTKRNLIIEVLQYYGKLSNHKESYEIYLLRSVCSELIKGSVMESKKAFLERHKFLYSDVANLNTFVNRNRMPYKLNIVAFLCKFPEFLYQITRLPFISRYISLR